MKNLYKTVIFAVYFALLFFVLPLVQNNIVIWLHVLVVVLFVTSYSLLAGGDIKFSIFLAFIFSLVFPIVMLTAIGLPVYHTVFATVESIIKYGGVELFFPFLAALTSGLILGKVRSNHHSSGTPNGDP
jgi:hypothetical protein